MLIDGHWIAIKDGDDRARWLKRRHYSARQYRDGRNPAMFVGPGEKMVLLTEDCLALWVWCKFKSMDNQEGVSCTIFRNEGPILSSLLVAEASALADSRWSGERQYTYVAPNKIASSNPGYCFKMAGWRKCGESAQGLHILERWPARVQSAAA